MRYAIIFSFVIIAFSSACSSLRNEEKSDQAKTEPEKVEQNIQANEENQPNAENSAASQRIPAAINSASLANLPQILSALQLNERQTGCGNIRIAVLDNGFYGLEAELGKTLPQSLKIEPAPKNSEQPNPHGTRMAQIIYSLCTGSRNYEPSNPNVNLKLYNTNGLTNLKHAVSDLIAKGTDLVLYSQVWEYGGNFNGAGFINQIINAAVDAGVVWVNAAGNYAHNTFADSVQRLFDGTVRLPYQGRYIRMNVTKAQTPVKLVLSWNDFSDNFFYRTAQDLDLIVETPDGKRVGGSEQVQDGIYRSSQEVGFSRHAREIVNLVLNEGVYFIKINAKSDNFGPNARLSLVASGYGVELIDRREDRVVMIPADNERVITIGAIDYIGSSRRNPLWGQSIKPDIYAYSEIRFSDGMEVRSTSTAAAIAAAGIATHMHRTGSRGFNKIKADILNGNLSRFADHEELFQACINAQKDGLTCNDPYEPSHTPRVLRIGL